MKACLGSEFIVQSSFPLSLAGDAVLISAIDPIQPVAAQDDGRRRECSMVQAAGSITRRNGESQQASATRATMTMVAVMGSMSFFWVAFNLPDPIEKPCDQPHSPC